VRWRYTLSDQSEYKWGTRWKEKCNVANQILVQVHPVEEVKIISKLHQAALFIFPPVSLVIPHTKDISFFLSLFPGCVYVQRSRPSLWRNVGRRGRRRNNRRSGRRRTNKYRRRRRRRRKRKRRRRGSRGVKVSVIVVGDNGGGGRREALVVEVVFERGLREVESVVDGEQRH
jgi:hypothetical protein